RLGRKYIGFELDKKYVEISQQKLERTEPNYKLGESWVSFYLKDIVTIRNNDWENLAKYFSIPNPLRKIDFERAKIVDKKLIPQDGFIEKSNDNQLKLDIKKNKTITRTKLKTTKEIVCFNTNQEVTLSKKVK
ncbi:MAG: hypothetical protein RBR64_05790, partial [Bacteroidales bacterium]|nr:hypothetical protein [Bacteroidales bacterium]